MTTMYKKYRKKCKIKVITKKVMVDKSTQTEPESPPIIRVEEGFMDNMRLGLIQSLGYG